MNETALSRQDEKAAMLERVVVGGDLSRLSPTERLHYYEAVCTSVGLNPLTRPFEYITLNGKLALYAKRDATDQLRKIHGVSITKLEIVQGEVYVVTAYARDSAGRVDSSTGAVYVGRLTGEALANAMMKAETKAKRRVTLSLCGLGMLDETEVDSIPGAVVGEAQTEVTRNRPVVAAPPVIPITPITDPDDPTLKAQAETLFPTPEDDERLRHITRIQNALKKKGASRGDAKRIFKAHLGSENPVWADCDVVALKELADKLEAEAG